MQTPVHLALFATLSLLVIHAQSVGAQDFEALPSVEAVLAPRPGESPEQALIRGVAELQLYTGFIETVTGKGLTNRVQMPIAAEEKYTAYTDARSKALQEGGSELHYQASKASISDEVVNRFLANLSKENLEALDRANAGDGPSREPTKPEARPFEAKWVGNPAIAVPHYRSMPNSWPAHTPKDQSLPRYHAQHWVATVSSLQHFIEVTTGQPASSVDSMPHSAKLKWKEYEAVRASLTEQFGFTQDQINAVKWGVRDFDGDTIRRMLSVENQAAYQHALSSPPATPPAEPPPVPSAVNSPALANLPSTHEVHQSLYRESQRVTREVAVLWTLMDYVAVVTGLPPKTAALLPQHRVYYDEQQRLRAEGGVRDFIGFYESKDFRDYNLRNLSGIDAASYWAVRKDGKPPAPADIDPTATPFKPVAANPIKDDGRYTEQKLAAKKIGLDLSVFGMKLYEPLNLPECDPDETPTMLAVITRIGIGSKYTCTGDDIHTTGTALAEAAHQALGNDPSPGRLQNVAVTLAHSKCPSWVVASGMCIVHAKVLDGYLIAAHAPTAPDVPGVIAPELTRKYGQKPKRLDSGVECRHPLTGALMNDTTDLQWRLDGLRVTYKPLTSCQQGLVMVDTPEFIQYMRKSGAQRKNKGPQM